MQTSRCAFTSCIVPTTGFANAPTSDVAIIKQRKWVAAHGECLVCASVFLPTAVLTRTVSIVGLVRVFICSSCSGALPLLSRFVASPGRCSTLFGDSAGDWSCFVIGARCCSVLLSSPICLSVCIRSRPFVLARSRCALLSTCSVSVNRLAILMCSSAAFQPVGFHFVLAGRCLSLRLSVYRFRALIYPFSLFCRIVFAVCHSFPKVSCNQQTDQAYTCQNTSIPGFVSVSSEHRSRFGAGECPGTAPGALSALSLARELWSNMGDSLGGHSQGPLLAIAWAQRGAP
eukprot:1542082-Pleurochrysis_carterae.AAC.1